MVNEKRISEYVRSEPLLEKVINLKPVTWLNEGRKEMAEMPTFDLGYKDMEEVVYFWERFAPFLAKVFPETAAAGGEITSPLKEVPEMKAVLEKQGSPIPGRVFVKCDSDLAVAGSIKARGGFYEVLHYAEQLALDAGYIEGGENYEIFATQKFKELFSKHRIG